MADCYSRLLRYLQFTGISCQFVYLFTDAPLSVVAMNGGDFIKNAHRNGQRGALHGGPLGANAAIPVVAMPGIHRFANLDTQDTNAKSVLNDAGDCDSDPKGIRQPVSTLGASIVISKLRGLS